MISWLVGAIIIGGMALRMIGISRPLLGNFAAYQTVNAMITKIFVANHFTSLLYPQLSILVDGKPALHLLAYPVCSLVASLFYFFLGGTIDFWGRFQADLFFGGSCLYLYRFVQMVANHEIALVSLIVFSLSPLTLIYGQSFQNEMATVFFSLLFFYELIKFIRSRKLLSALCCSLGWSGVLLTRPNGLYLLVPVFYWVWNQRGKRRGSFLRAALVLLGGSILPGLWYFHIWNVTRSSANIYNSVFAQLATRSSFLSPYIFSVDYYRGLLDNLAGVAFTPIGFTLFVLGLLLGVIQFQRRGLFITWSLAFLGSSFLIPRKLIDHNFYLLHLLVPAAPLIADTWNIILKNLGGSRLRVAFTASFLLIVSFISLRYGAHPAFKTPEVEKHFPYLASKVKAMTNKEEASVLVQGTHILLYYADRYGIDFKIKRKNIPFEYYKFTGLEKVSPEQREARQKAWGDNIEYLEYLRKYEHVTHFVVTDPEEFHQNENFSNYMFREYPVIYEEKGIGYIFSLNLKK